MSVKTIKPKHGQLYSEACAEVLSVYVSLDDMERELVKENPQVKEAYRNFVAFHPSQRRAFFGDLVDKMKETKC